MRSSIITLLFAMVILSGNIEARGQTTLAKQNSCQPSTEEILSLIKSAFNASPVAENVLIAGEIKGGAGALQIFEDYQLTLTRAIAMLGGIRKQSSRSVYVIRQSADGGAGNKLEFNYDNINKGLASNLVLEKGDVIFVPRGCSGGKLLQPTPKTTGIDDKLLQPAPKKTNVNEIIVSSIYNHPKIR